MGIRRRAEGGRRSDSEELAVYRAFVEQLTRTCQAAARGDLEARSRPTDGVADVPQLQALNDGVNRVLDISDAFVREASAALTSAAAGRFHRSVLLGGLARAGQLLDEGGVNRQLLGVAAPSASGPSADAHLSAPLAR